MGSVYPAMGQPFIPIVAVIWFVAATKPFCAHAEYFRGIDDLKRHDLAGAIQELTPAAEAGEADAEGALGIAYDESASPGPARARELFRKAADDGLLLGMLNLALSLQEERGGPVNPAEAVEGLTRAAQAGVAPAMVSVADAYRTALVCRSTRLKRRTGTSGRPRSMTLVGWPALPT